MISTIIEPPDPALAREALELGAIAYVNKPFDFACLTRVVANDALGSP
jgi:AmiR/NasT family two-component response regulator